MKITIFGTGYVGLVTGACLADVGHHVLCMDVDQGKIDKLRNGHIPIYEPGLESIVKHTVEAGRLAFTTDTQEAVAHGSLQFIAVGTPPDEDGSADLQYVTAVARSIGQYMDDYKVVVDKSTVPVGTGDRVKAAVRSELDKRGLELDFDGDKERLSQLGNLAATVAHEIRNPLNSISVGLQRLKAEFHPTDDEEQYLRFIELMRGEVQRLNAIVEEFLSLARPLDLKPETVKVDELLQELALLAVNDAEPAKVQIRIVTPDDMPSLRADRNYLKQLLLNLILNGIQAMPARRGAGAGHIAPTLETPLKP